MKVMLRRLFVYTRTLATPAAALLLTATPAQAVLDIVYTHLSANTNPNIVATADIMPFDQDSSRLLAILNHVASVYENAFEDLNRTVEITYWWDNYNGVAQSAPAWIVEDNDGVTMSGVRFTTNLANQLNANWFIDNTPAQDEEFDMGQQLFRDLSMTTQTARYLGDTPALFETAYFGSKNSNGPSGTILDLLSVAFQEVGHAIGMNAGFSGTSNGTNTGEGDDFKFDLPTAWVHGDTMALKARGYDANANGAPLPGDAKDHIVSSDVAMGTANTNKRVRPSAADLLAIAVSANYNDVDLPRKDFLGGNAWTDGFNWLGGAAPDGNDDVFVRHGSPISVALTTNRSVANLTVAESSQVAVAAGNTLTVFNETTIERGPIATNQRSGISIGEGSELDTPLLTVNDGGDVTTFGGFLDIDDAHINEGGRLIGNGTVFITNALRNDGQILASKPFGLGGDVLSFITNHASPFDLDGSSGNGVVTAAGASISFNFGLSDTFNGTMEVNDGLFINFGTPWDLGNGGLIDLNGGGAFADRARITGAPLNAEGGSIQASGQAHFDNTVTLGPSISVSLAANANLEFNATTTIEGGDYTIADGAVLEFDAETTVNAANFIITGTGRVQFDAATTYSYQTVITSTGLIQQNADATIIGAMTVNGGRFDLDGAAALNTIRLGNAANPGPLTLNVDGIDSAGNVFNSTIETEDVGIVGGLTINLTNPDDAWTMAGTLNLHGGNPLFLPTRVAGSRMIVTGEINLTNRVRIAADTDFNPTATVNATGFNDELHVSGNTTIFAGADFNGLMTMVNTASGELTLAHGAAIPFVILENNGTLRIGNSPGSANVNRYTQGENATWEVELGGTEAGIGHDKLITAGLPAELAGTLALSIIGEYTPNYYDEFVILTAGTRIGEFDHITGALIDPDMTLAPIYDYKRNTGVTIVAALPGDANLDQTVNGLDLLAWQANLFSGNKWVQGDFNLDGMVNGLDLLIWQSHLFDSVPVLSRGVVATATEVPEPGAATLLLGLCGLIAKRRRNNSH